MTSIEALNITEQLRRAETETPVVTGIEALQMTEHPKRVKTETTVVTGIEALQMTEQPKRAETVTPVVIGIEALDIDRTTDLGLSSLPRIVSACFVLHNICELRNTSVDDDSVAQQMAHNNQVEHPNRPDRA